MEKVNKNQLLPLFDKLNNKQKKCILLMAEGDFTQAEIASQIDVSPETISRWKKQKNFISALDEYTRYYLHSFALDATRTLKKLLKARSEMVRLQAAKDILDRAGYTPDANTSGNSEVLDDGFIDAIDNAIEEVWENE
ncbi:phBC6A51 family helix-turn-helix protein [Listeria sp. ILCC792]|uniref:phBC6A51 family helix-turn-helix protein n=1 Tax=Listeria sp. ILCC792 TaxID=1918331 RepID=UPI000B58AF01|nr:phBC6A51 family helix-turn-helix protein [Listeria sp. ILCC792]